MELILNIICFLIVGFVIFCIVGLICVGFFLVYLYIRDIYIKIKDFFEERKEPEKKTTLDQHCKKLKEQYFQEQMAVEKGAYFENRIRDLILYYFPGSKVRQNVIIKNDNFSKEIDLIAMTTKGFFVIEAKNYNGCKIDGSPKNKNWNCTYSNGNTYSMYNPIFQASSGIWNIKKHISTVYLDKAVIFSDNCELDRDILNDPSVYTFSSFNNTLISLQYDKPDIYSETSIQQFDEMIERLDTVSRDEHIENVKKVKNSIDF